METKSLADRIALGPPTLLEKFVLLLIPPAAREIVAGDLCELYRSPAQYAGEALGALPFIVLSQAWRKADLPVLLLQGLVLAGWFALLSGSTDFAVGATAAILMGGLLLKAYRGRERPSLRGAILTLVAAGIAAQICVMAGARFWPDGQVLPYFVFFVAFLVPSLTDISYHGDSFYCLD